MRTGSGREEEANRLNKLAEKLSSQAKTAVSLMLLGGIDAISILLTPVLYILLIRSLGPTAEFYALFHLHCRAAYKCPILLFMAST